MAEDLLTSSFVRLRQRLKTVAGGIVRSDSDAEDILQEAFLKLWRRRYPLTTDREADAVLFRVVRNESLNRRKKRSSTVPLAGDVAGEEGQDAMERERAYREMETAIDQELTALQKYILRKKEYEGMTLEKIARQLGMEASAVRMQLSRARQKLRKALTGNG